MRPSSPHPLGMDMPLLRVQPDPSDPRLTRRVTGRDHTGAPVETAVTVERPLTLYLNGQEIVTMMTIRTGPKISPSAIC